MDGERKKRGTEERNKIVDEEGIEKRQKAKSGN